MPKSVFSWSLFDTHEYSFPGSVGASNEPDQYRDWLSGELQYTSMVSHEIVAIMASSFDALLLCFQSPIKFGGSVGDCTSVNPDGNTDPKNGNDPVDPYIQSAANASANTMIDTRIVSILFVIVLPPCSLMIESYHKEERNKIVLLTFSLVNTLHSISGHINAVVVGIRIAAHYLIIWSTLIFIFGIPLPWQGSAPDQ